MKKLLPIISGLTILGIVFTVGYHSSVFSFSGGAPNGNTNGLGEGNCSNCHGGTPNLNATALTFNAGSSSYQPGATAMTITINSGITSTRQGFQLKAVTANDVSAGTITAGTGNKVVGSAIKYLTHSTPSATGSYTFTWTPPATNVGPVTFYVAASKRNPGVTNINSFTLTPATGLPNPFVSSAVKLFPNPATDRATISYELSEASDVIVQVTTLAGQMVSNYNLGKQAEGQQTFTLPLAGHVAAGQYVVRLVSNGNIVSHKLVVL